MTATLRSLHPWLTVIGFVLAGASAPILLTGCGGGTGRSEWPTRRFR